MKYFIIFSMLLFNTELENIQYDKIDNSVIIILDNYYCKDCYESICEVSKSWKNNYSTVVITKSKYSKSVAIKKSMYIKLKLDFDEIYFLKYDKELGFKEEYLQKYKIKKTPAIIIKKDNQEFFIDSDTLFMDFKIERIQNLINRYL